MRHHVVLRNPPLCCSIHHHLRWKIPNRRSSWLLREASWLNILLELGIHLSGTPWHHHPARSILRSPYKILSILVLRLHWSLLRADLLHWIPRHREWWILIWNL